MNEDFPPRSLAEPKYRKYKKPKPGLPPLPPEVLARRGEIARILGVKVEGLNKYLSSLTSDQRKAIFFKVTHDGPISLSGTGLKPLVDRSDKITLVVPTGDNLDSFTKKIERFASAEPSDTGRVPNQDYARIEEIERGDPKDRLSDELLAEYDAWIKSPSVICEIEMLSIARGSNQRRTELKQILLDLQNSFASGVHGTLFEHEERDGSCRAVIRCTGKMFKRLVEEDEWQRKISWFEPKPRFETFHTTWDNFQFDKLAPIAPPPKDAPVICIIDSGVSPGNPFLEPVTKEEMLKSFLRDAADDPYDEVGHGSGVASLASYYALTLEEGDENVAKAWIASARILDASNQIEEDRLFSKVLEEVVDVFVPLGVRIFNLSVADLAKKWNQDTKRTQPRTSWVARTIDRLSHKHDVVFVVATGNILAPAIRDNLRSGKEYPAYLCEEDSRILDPGQAALALSVGSIALGTLVAHSPDTVIALENEPSPFTRSGPGIKGETKPDLVDVGGNLVRDAELNWVRDNPGTNVVMASNKLSPAAAHDFGTSYSAPRVANKLAVLLHELKQLGIDPVSAPLLKAFLVNSASYRGDLTDITDKLDAISKKRWLDVLGYGFPDPSRATECDDYSILLYHQGTIEFDEVAFFDIPVPAVLADSSAKKRITVTTAHYPEVQKWGLESYLGVDLKWRMFRGDVDRQEVIEAMSQDETGDGGEREPNDLPSELQFDHKITRRSRGAVQHDRCEWTQHRSQFSENHYTLAIAAYKRWNRTISATRYGCVVRIEDLGATVPLYVSVSTAIDTLVELQAEAGAR